MRNNPWASFGGGENQGMHYKWNSKFMKLYNIFSSIIIQNFGSQKENIDCDTERKLRSDESYIN